MKTLSLESVLNSFHHSNFKGRVHLLCPKSQQFMGELEVLDSKLGPARSSSFLGSRALYYLSRLKQDFKMVLEPESLQTDLSEFKTVQSWRDDLAKMNKSATSFSKLKPSGDLVFELRNKSQNVDLNHVLKKPKRVNEIYAHLEKKYLDFEITKMLVFLRKTGYLKVLRKGEQLERTKA